MFPLPEVAKTHSFAVIGPNCYRGVSVGWIANAQAASRGIFSFRTLFRIDFKGKWHLKPSEN